MTNKLKVMALGGLGEIGKNMTVFEYNDQIIIVDCGIAFPDEEMYGVDLIIPDIKYLLENEDKILGLFITHAHEDHIGGIPYFLKQLNVPIYATRLSKGMIESKLVEHRLQNKANVQAVQAGDIIKFDDLSVEFIQNTHSIADSCSLAIHTPLGIVLHTGDFKIDFTPIDEKRMDLERIATLAQEGILLLMADSTNVERKGYTMSERSISETFDKLFAQATGRVLVATFASNIHRMQQIIDASIKYGRKVAFSGRSMETISGVARELGYLHIADEQLITLNDINNYADREITLITTGSQGEPMAALARIAFGSHRQLKLHPDDFIIISAAPIPGNDKLIARVINELYRKGAKVIYKDLEAVHVSGHACQEELKLIHTLCHPKYFMPVHGEYRHLVHHKELAIKLGMNADDIFVMETGDVLEIDETHADVSGRIHTGAILIDGIGIGDVGSIVLRDRKMLAEEGMLTIVATIDKSETSLVAGPDIITRGFVYAKEADELIFKVKDLSRQTIEDYLSQGITERMVIKNGVKKVVEKHIYKHLKRRPSVFPIIMEI